MQRRWGILLLLSACIETNLTACPDGLACPVGLVCDVAHRSCTTQEQLDACVGKLDRDRCTAPAVADGACHEGVCLPIGCANGRLDPGEACDDGNQVSLDDCSADCLSDETCGNGVLDVIEDCDDGNVMSHDRCDSQCNDEVLQWERIEVRASPGVQGPASAWDETRGRMVLFGGVTSTVSVSTTLEWDGNGWSVRSATLAPSPRTRTAMAYDASRNQIVLFGGKDAIGDQFDTWIWDGSHWTEVTPASGPRARYGHAMAYDPVRRRVVLFGGAFAANASALHLNDTWEWDGATWTQINLPPNARPFVRTDAAMAYDPRRNVIVMYGGNVFGTPSAETSVYDGTTWTNAANSAPGARGTPALSYSPTRDALVLTGNLSEIWLWSGTWQLDNVTSTFAATPALVSFFDPTRGKTLLASATEMWAYDETAVTQIAVSQPPGSRTSPSLEFDPLNGEVVMFGGRDDTNALTNGVWELDTSWHPKPTLPTAAWNAPMAYDEARRRFVLYVRSSASMGEVWERDEAGVWTMAWSNLISVDPSPRVGAVIAYDAARAVTVMFGGGTGAVEIAETWLWDGTSWTNAAPVVSPPRRSASALVYDPVRRTTLMFGGVFNDDPSPRLYGDTWEWDGATWADVTPSTSASPTARYAAGLAYDSRRHKIMMVGGGVGLVGLTDVWEWDGARWNRLHTEPTIGRSGSYGSIAYDPLRAQLVVSIGEVGVSTGYWALRWSSDARDEICTSPIDHDGDGAVRCADPDCWAACTPLCPPATSCTTGPRCGDGVCGAIESCGLCAADCGECATRCGDFACTSPEAVTTCPGDCTP